MSKDSEANVVEIKIGKIMFVDKTVIMIEALDDNYYQVQFDKGIKESKFEKASLSKEDVLELIEFLEHALFVAKEKNKVDADWER